MDRRNILYICLCFCFMSSLIVFPSLASEGVKYGLKLCCSVIIPSLFPFTVASLIIYNVKITFLSKKLIIIILSFLGGYPVGAKLIDSAYKNLEIDKRTAELMLGYCVNSGPAFIVIVIGSKLWNNNAVGAILLVSSILSSLLIMLMNENFVSTKSKILSNNYSTQTFSDIFTEATYNATESMFKICGAVVLFSAIIFLIKPILQNIVLSDYILSILEITNGVVIAKRNIYLTAFLIGFGGLSVHFQVLSICSNVKPSFIRFLFYRILHGALCAVITSFFLRIFKISIETGANSAYFNYELTKYSIVFSVMLMICCILFMISVKKSNNLL